MLHACSLTEDCPPHILNDTEITPEEIKNNTLFNLMISMDIKNVTQHSVSPLVWLLYAFAILHDLLSLLTQFYMCEIYVITGFVLFLYFYNWFFASKNKGHNII